MRRGLALDRRIGGEDDLAYLALLQQALELIEPELHGADPVEGREMSHEHEIAPAKTTRLLDRHDVGRRFDDTQLSRIALRCAADAAELSLGQHATAPAMPDARQRLGQGLGERARTVAVALQQVKGHALRRLRPDARQ